MTLLQLLTAAMPLFSVCAQHGRILGGASPPISWLQRMK